MLSLLKVVIELLNKVMPVQGAAPLHWNAAVSGPCTVPVELPK